ncbi:hypothetical protein H2200_001843 [Cladophialophora chaetospira]|uniref:Uncharacterized protein n=1 Tax=Cladophialophora chaetospira TaxID=386627 RepID=A0AA38XLS7_9EURO|nr:hypothetical protein H2200_001843 [Cladophialophora chaetospira]
MSNHYHHSGSSSRFRKTQHHDFATASQDLPSQAALARSRDQRMRTPARTQTVSMSWPGDTYFQAMHSPVATIQRSAMTAQSSPQHDPTLAPELPLDDSDFIAMLQTPQGNQPVSYIPDEMTIAAQSKMEHEQIEPSASEDGNIFVADGDWNSYTLDYPANTSSLLEPSVHVQMDPDFDFGNIGLGCTSAQEDKDHRATPIDSYLPDLPASTGTQFELLDRIQDFATGALSSVAQYHESGTLVVPGYTAQYPDPAEFNTSLSPTPDFKSSSTTPSKQHGTKGVQRDTSTDLLLVQLRQGGKSYKQIKEILGLEEAESTLRGRYRTLIKPKEARVRKPEWTCDDVRLLFDGVLHFSNSIPIAHMPYEYDAASIRHFTNKVPWKQVAEWMEDQGTYKYGNATVKKKYLAELKRRGAPI